MPRFSLAAKITLVIVAVSIVGFGASTIWTIHHESLLAIDESKAAARRLAATLVASIESAMLQERPDVTRALIQELRGASPVEGLAGLLQPIQLHMGINTGEALVGATKLASGSAQRWTFTATGPTTNLAARLSAFAGEGEIVVGPVTAERIRHHFVLEGLGERTFENVSAPIRVYRVIPPGVYEKVV